MRKQHTLLAAALLTSSLAAPLSNAAQDNVYPAKPYAGILQIRNATIHVGNGEVIENGTIEVNNGKIIRVGKDLPTPASGVMLVDAAGRHAYPGLILSISNLGLVEIPTVRATSDVQEIGELNPSIRSIVAYNTDSKITNTVRSNGILLANIVPDGGTLSGSSSVVQLDAWNWEDAAYRMDGGLHFRMPSLFARPSRFGGFGGMRGGAPDGDPVKKALEEIEAFKAFLREARAYAAQPSVKEPNLKMEAVRGLFDRKQKFYIHCDVVKEILVALDLVKEFGLDAVIVGGSECWRVAGLLKQHNVPVILNQMHEMPTLSDDDIDQPYKTPYLLQQAGVLFAINDADGQHRGKNLPFNAGTAAAYGLAREQALSAITLNAAKILGIADRTGSLEVGKDANIVLSKGDILDMRSSVVTHAFIQGRQLDLNDKHKQLNERYRQKYGLQ
ncbi:MAG: amidohydrolase family protein [Bacteroidetes bacterium]|nr:amidohydrolase family protein [Bacteroidota bacterium]